MATDYPIEITDPDGSVRIAGLADFTDPGNQPAQGGALEPPLVVPETGTTVLITDTPDGDDLLDYDADAAAFNFGPTVNIAQALNAVSGTFQVTANEIGAFGTTPVSQPVVPLTSPLPQDIINALLALGLVSQSD